MLLRKYEITFKVKPVIAIVHLNHSYHDYQTILITLIVIIL